MNLSLSSPVNATLGTQSTAVLNILDDGVPPPTVQFVLANFTASERDPSATISVFLSAAFTQPVTVVYATSDGTGTAPQNYLPATGKLTFAPGETFKDFQVVVVDDFVVNSDKTVNLTLSSAQNATLGIQNTATLTITDADALPTVQFDSDNFTVSEVGNTADIRVILSSPSILPITVNYATSDGTATAPNNYGQTMGVLTFTPGQTEQTFQVLIFDDFVVDPNLTVNLTLSSPNNATLGTPNTATLTIIDADAPVTVQFYSATYTAKENDITASIYVVLSAPFSQTVSVNYATSNGSAKTPENYLPAAGTLTFAPGQTGQSFQIVVVDDFVVQPDLTVNLTLSGAQNATLGAPNTATLTITEADALPTVQFVTANYTVEKADGTGTISVFLSAPCTQAVTVNYATSDGTATAPTDYSPAMGVLNFAPSETIKYFQVGIVDNLDLLPDRTVNLTLSSPQNATLGFQRTGTLTITEPLPTVTFSPDPVYVNQGESAALTATVSPSAATVVFASADPTIATVTPGPAPNLTVNGIRLGTTQIEAMYHGAPIAFVNVIVTQKAPPDPMVLIWADINRDGKINDDDKPTKWKLEIGTIVIADKDSVYADTDYPARRREIKTTTTVAGAKTVVVKRSSNNLLLYDAQTAGTELFGAKDEVSLAPGTSYWLHGGATPSASVRDHWLQARQDKPGAAFEDQVNVTVTWVDIFGDNSGKMKKPPVYDGYAAIIDNSGHDNLGVFRSTATSGDKDVTARGSIQVRGKIQPNNFSFVGGDTEGFQNKVDPKTMASKASARFGFVFKRQATTKYYRDGNYEKKSRRSRVDFDDDSSRDFQDVQPNLDKDDKNNLLIIDHDGPTLDVVRGNQMFAHIRYNFVEKVVFHFDDKGPERVS